MKNLFYSLSIFMALILVGFTFPQEKESSEVRNSCKVKITYSSGTGMSGIRVVGSVCGGISCVGNTETEYSDGDGYVTLYWSSGCKLCYIYVDGKEYKGSYDAGGTYTFTK